MFVRIPPNRAQAYIQIHGTVTVASLVHMDRVWTPMGNVSVTAIGKRVNARIRQKTVKNMSVQPPPQRLQLRHLNL